MGDLTLSKFRIEIKDTIRTSLDRDKLYRALCFIHPKPGFFDVYHDFDKKALVYSGETTNDVITVMTALARGDDTDRVIALFETVE